MFVPKLLMFYFITSILVMLFFHELKPATGVKGELQAYRHLHKKCMVSFDFYQLNPLKLLYYESIVTPIKC